jgi:hypothetical protein
MDDFNIKNGEILKAILHNTIQANTILMAQTELMLKIFTSSQEEFNKLNAFYVEAAEKSSVQIREQLYVLFGDLDIKKLLGDE